MALYNTVPAEESTLLAPKKDTKTKGLVVIAAFAAFALGAVAATATRATPAKEVINLSKGGKCSCPGGSGAGSHGDDDDYTDLRKCLDENKGCGTITLEEGDFWLGAPQYAIPYGTTIQGKGPEKTRITAANSVWIDCTKSYDPTIKIGFILGDNTKVKDFTFISLDESRWNINSNGGGLCGGAVFEAPGCTHSDCSDGGQSAYSYEGNDYITNAEVSNIFITGQNSPGDTCWWKNPATDDCKTAPQVSVWIPSSASGKCTSGVTVRGVTMFKSNADSLNVHGCAHDITIDGNTLWYPGDDNFGIWSMPKSDGPGLRDIFITNNDVSQVRNVAGDCWGSCLAPYGFREKLVFAGNVCRGHFNVEKKNYCNHGAIMFSPLFCGKGDGSDFSKCTNDDMFPKKSSIYITGTTFLDNDKDDASKASFPYDTWQTCGARDNAFTDGSEFPHKARINNCVMSSGGWDQGSGHYGCADPSFILDGCNDVHWDDNGPEGYGWYCFQFEGKPTYTEPSSKKTIKYAPDLYNIKGSKDWPAYANSCIHLNCKGIGYDNDNSMWQCLDDFDASAMTVWDLAWAAQQGGRYAYKGNEGGSPLYDDTKHNGYFKYDDGKDQLCWDAQLDGESNPVCYHYDTSHNDGTYTLYTGNNGGYYKVYNYCTDDACWIQFDCLINNTDDWGNDC